MLTITTNSFENDVLHADKPVLVDFWAQWCPYCRRIAPAFDKVGEQYADTLITGANGDTGMLLFHLHEHLLRRGVPLKLRDGGQYFLCVFRHTANLLNTRISLILSPLLYPYFSLCQQPQGSCAPKLLKKP